MFLQNREEIKTRKRRPTSLLKVDWLISAGGKYKGSQWDGKRYRILVQLKGRRKPIVITSARPYDKMVDKRGSLFTDIWQYSKE